MRIPSLVHRQRSLALVALAALACGDDGPIDSTKPTDPTEARQARFAFMYDGYIYVVNADGSDLTRLTGKRGANREPELSPDGTGIAFMSSPDDNYEVYVMDADGSGQTNLTRDPADDWWPAWSPDGTKIAFLAPHEFIVMSPDGGGAESIAQALSFPSFVTWRPEP